MRTNLPVTQREHPFPRGEAIVSTTDLKGRITYCNPGFVALSGYTRDELLGQPHNLIRHPDMPEEAFRDLWATVAAGRPWSGVVKNRRKDGDHYWVLANVTPLMEGGRPVGYMSVRTEAPRAAIDAAERLYATMREEKSRGHLVHALRAGRVVERSLAGRARELLHFGLSGRLAAAALALAAAGVAAATSLPAPAAAAAAVLVGAVGGLLLHRLTVAPLKPLLRFANRMAAGDLTQALAVQRHDLTGQLGQALNQLDVNLLSIVRDARTEVDRMRQATREIVDGNQDLAARTESQAASLEETAASMEQITGTVRQSADAAQQASALASQAMDVAERGSAAVGELARTMGEIASSSTRIGEIVQVIDGIAFQTNLLALNAAVEAARTGEQGRGFAVVAAEVRALAQRTAGAAKEVKRLVEASAETVRAGTARADAARRTMDESLAAARGVGRLIDEIGAGAREQLLGITQVNEAVAQMDGITQRNAALVQQLAVAAQALDAQAEAVANAVGVFRLDAAATPIDAVALRRAARDRRAPALRRAARDRRAPALQPA
ncbi:methyl-accepting chemotaxis protein [Caldimonas sp. KR1-144]|uniref:methyl-accepting chemotaxis protein n=1 Tax=Caldimonas sp. KR1-144 TaxID=3400911 RepID=UPI003BFBC8F2